MRKAVKVIGIIFGVIILMALAGFVYFNSKYPKAGPAKNIKIEYTQERIERGKYLANHVTMCMDCHSTRDWSTFSGPMVPGTEGKGGERYDKAIGIPGELYSKNLTPAHLKTWTDGEILRAITSGVNKDGKVLFPLMPYPNFKNMSQEDLYSIIAYLRTLKPIENNIPESKVDFPLSLIMKTFPEPYSPQTAPGRSNPKEYGKYLVTIAGCADCHTQSVKGEPVKGMHLAGGTAMKLPWGTIRTANITPDKETGIGNWTKEDFINRFRTFRSKEVYVKVNMKTDFNTIMPWQFFSGMTDEDLGAIYEYLHSIQPVYNPVNKFTPNAEGIKQVSENN